MGFPGLPTEHVWYSLGRWGWANIKWCEETLMGWVTEPANTWSNFAFVLSGLLIIKLKSRPDHKLLQLMPFMVICLGFLSGFYHATNAWITQLGDFLGMYIVATIPLLMNIERLGLKSASSLGSYVLVNIFLVGLTAWAYYMKFPIQLLFAILMGFVLLTEVMLLKSSPLPSYRNLMISLGFFAIGATFSALDVTRTMCDPQNHVVQGHAIWHLFTSVGVYFADSYCRDMKFSQVLMEA